jgi:hypothetical protein
VSVRMTPRWPALAGVAILLAVVGVLLRASLQANGGHFVYAQDDPYIHLTIARTLAEHGVWGISPGVFAPASSSPLWTILLAACHAAGWSGLGAPFVLNAIAGVLVVLLLDRELLPFLKPGPRIWTLLALGVAIPLPTLVFIGMEHTLHIAAVLWLACAGARRLAADEDAGPWYAGALAACIAAGLRYESAFVILPLAGLHFARGRRSTALLLVAGMMAAVGAFAAYSMAHGGLPVPNPILLKSGAERFGSAGGALAIVTDWVNLLSAFQYPAVTALAIAACVTVMLAEDLRSRLWSFPILLPVVFVSAAVLHVCFVRLSSFYRYEAYLIALGGLAVAVIIAESGGRFLRSGRGQAVGRWAAIACAVLLGAPVAKRGAEALLTVTRATHEIYAQQYQMATFLREYYPHAPVAVNDIGLVSWLAPVHVVDLLGLASPEVADARRHGANDRAFYERLLTREGVVVACVYERYFAQPDIIPATWHRVARWGIGYHIAVGDDVVSFFARSDEDARRLASALEQFAARLPGDATYLADARKAAE